MFQAKESHLRLGIVKIALRIEDGSTIKLSEVKLFAARFKLSSFERKDKFAGSVVRSFDSRSRDLNLGRFSNVIRCELGILLNPRFSISRHLKVSAYICRDLMLLFCIMSSLRLTRLASYSTQTSLSEMSRKTRF